MAPTGTRRWAAGSVYTRTKTRRRTGCSRRGSRQVVSDKQMWGRWFGIVEIASGTTRRRHGCKFSIN
eukprot:9479477-Pyramimonas_sp.AAC.2